MASINFLTLLTNPLFGAAPQKNIEIQSSKLQAFQFNETPQIQDRFLTNPLYQNFKSKVEIEQLAKSNPRIMQLLKENGIPLKVNIEALEALKAGHLKDTRIIAAKIASNLRVTTKQEISLKDIQLAAMLHDYGKVLIPKEILEKKGALTSEERKIMQLHAEFGYELLKQQGGINEEVLNLIKYHHQKPGGSGYPEITKNYEYDINAQILKVADMYSALTESRAYHKPYSKEEALNIIYKEVEAGAISQEVFDALKQSI